MYACMCAHMHMLVRSVRLNAELVKKRVTIIVLEIWNVILCEQLCFCVFFVCGCETWLFIRRAKDRSVDEYVGV